MSITIFHFFFDTTNYCYFLGFVRNETIHSKVIAIPGVAPWDSATVKDGDSGCINDITESGKFILRYMALENNWLGTKVEVNPNLLCFWCQLHHPSFIQPGRAVLFDQQDEVSTG